VACKLRFLRTRQTVRADFPATSADQADDLQGVGGASAWTKTMTAIMEVASKTGSITIFVAICTTRSPHRRNASGRCLPSGLGMYTRRTGCGRYPPARKKSLQFQKERLDSLLLDHRQGLPVDPGSAFVTLHPLPCFQQNVTPPDPIVQRMKAAFRLSLGRDIQAALEFSRFGKGFAFAVTLSHWCSLLPSP